MAAWWYADKGKKTGPVETEELGRLLQTGRIEHRTMVWQEGMEAWRPLDEIDELYRLKDGVPPPLPPKTSPDSLTYPLATRWSRFFARIFDVWWEILLVAFAVGAALSRYSAWFVAWINGPGESQLFGILCLPIALILDAVLFRVVGNTPGKVLLGLKVETLDGKPLSLVQYLGRNFSMWATGLALGIPFINLFTMANQSHRLGKGQQASYDESTGFRVRAHPYGWVRKTAFGLAFAGLFAGLFVVMAVLTSMEQAAQREAILNAAQDNYSWENPVTRIDAKISSNWKHAAQSNEEGQQIYMFSERTDHAVVILGTEQAPGYALDDYVRAFQKSMANNMRFSDSGRFFERDGRHTWEGSGSMIASPSNRLSVQVVQVGSAFWRVVTIQTMPYDYSDAMVRQLHGVLWSTVK